MSHRIGIHRNSAPTVLASFALAVGFLISAAAPAGATKYAGSFMADGGGARALGMGSAFVAVADDASATFWNPAGLTDLPRRQLLAMHSERFGDIVDRDFASYVHPLRGDGGWSDGAFAFSVIHLAVDDIAFTEHLEDQLDTNNDGVVDASEAPQLLDPLYFDQIEFKTDRELAFFATYARRAGAWQVGGTVKMIRQTVGDYSSFGLGVDVGALRRDWWRSLDVGVKLQDATSTYLGWSTGRNETIAPVVVPGAAYDWHFEGAQVGLLLAGAVEMHFDNRGQDVDQFGSEISGNLHLGLEATLRRKAHLRVGSHGGWDSEHLTFGAGLELDRYRVDYAHAGDVLDIDESTHRVSVSVDF